MPNHLTHGPRRPFWRPWATVCRCGLAAWPCYVVKMRKAQEALLEPPGRPVWNAPTTPYPTAPLLTRLQQERSRPGGDQQ